MQNDSYYRIEIYQDPSRYNSFFCRVIRGHRVKIEHIMDPRWYFEPTSQLFEMRLNGPGKNKALKKVRATLRNRGLEHLIFFDDTAPGHVKKEDLVLAEP